jgi:hypothetical protein
MRIDGTSLIAAQSSFRAQPAPKAPPTPAQAPPNALFENLDFPKVEHQDKAARPAGMAVQTPAPRPGAQLDITV